jgi:enoyl-CoA hydratase/carnithine racemase
VITAPAAPSAPGGNLQRLLDKPHKPPEAQAQSIEGLHGWIDAIRTFPKPVIAPSEGAAAGAGFSLALGL